MMVGQEAVEQLVGMLSESLALCRQKEDELTSARNRIHGLREDVVVRDGELRALREARAQERAEPQVPQLLVDQLAAYKAMLDNMHAVLDELGIDPGLESERLDSLRDVVRAQDAIAKVADLETKMQDTLDDAGIDGPGPVVDRLDKLVAERDAWKEKAGLRQELVDAYADLDGPDRPAPRREVGEADRHRYHTGCATEAEVRADRNVVGADRKEDG